MKFTLNLCDAQVCKTKNSEISCSYMIIKENLFLQTDRYIQFILQSDPGFQGSTHVLVISTFHIYRQIPYLEKPVFRVSYLI